MDSSIKLPLFIKVLLGSAFMMNAGTFMVIPFLVVYLSKTLQFNHVEVATILSANLVFGRLLPFITGLLGDRISHRVTLLIGVFLRGIGFIGFAVFESFIGLFATSALIGIGGAFYDPSVMTIFASQNEKERKKSLTFLNQALNAGAVLGPLFAAGLLLLDPTVPFLVSGVILIAIAIVLGYFSKHIQTKKSESTLFVSVKQIMGNRKYLYYLVIMTFYWMAFSQLSVSIPLYVFDLTKDEKMISMVFTVNGVTGLVMMFFLRNVFTKYTTMTLIQKGAFISGISLLLLPLMNSFPWLLFMIFVFTLGETLILPSSDMAIAEFSNNENTGGYYGLFELSFAGGTIIGNYLGTYMMGINSVYPWFIYGGMCLVTFVLIRFLARQSKRMDVNEMNKMEV
ncbi:MFS transporter [Bacillus sp. CH30_1T]|uniref:MFS transporter n=1 Tax=Bacillus sp. CH30_1T TaxID=2604836 RepID=UPI0011ECF23B|nr:MFS transporter [Bacillus sp. CH30_1T]KAA0563502.1 MFS transporter [Bacillus sp. CH30_1T]